MNYLSKYFNECFCDEQELIVLVDNLCSNYKVILFGGFVRDYLFKGEYNYRDVDIVVDIKSDVLKSTIKKYIKNAFISVNHFNGYKIQFEKVTVDLWSLEDTWAIKHNYFSKEQLLDTVYLNIDAYAYNLSSNTYIDNCDIKPKPTEIDIRFAINPNEKLNLIRCLVLSKKYKLHISTSLKKKLAHLVNYHSNDDIIETLQIEHYGRIIIPKSEFKSIINQWEVLNA